MKPLAQLMVRVLIFLGLASTMACSHFLPLEPGATAAPAAGPPADSCEARALIENAEDGDTQTVTSQGRGGYVYTYADETGTSVTPQSSRFRVSPGGPPGSRHALHMAGKTADADDTYAGMGFSFVDPKGAYDASEYSGVAFLAKRGPGSATTARMKLPDAHTDPQGGECKECYNDFGVDFELNEEWTRYVVAFADLKQESGWGRPRPDNVDPKKLFGMQWQVSTRATAFDVWIDDVTFVGCDEKK
jgi:hypothetical protein